MASTTFSNGTVVQPEWLNDLNGVAYKALIMATNATYAPVGNGTTNDTTALQALFDAASLWGAEIVLEKNKTYAATVLTLGARARLTTNGASFVDLNGTTSNTAFLTIGDDVQWDHIKITIPTGKRRDRVINITGDRTSGKSIIVESVDQQATNTDTADVCVKYNAVDDFNIDYIKVTNYDRAVNFETCNNFRVNSISVVSYVRGVLVSDCTNGYFGQSWVRTASPNTSTAAGSNGLLMQCNSDYAQQNLTFDAWAIQNAGEHAVRCGGEFSHRAITFRDFKLRDNGACGIKVLGTDLGAPTEYNEAIYVINPVIEDGGTSLTAAENRVGVMFEYVKYGFIINPIIRKVNNSKCASFGIRLNGCEDISISGGVISDPQFDAVLLRAENGDNKRISINNISTIASSRHGVNITTDVGKTTDEVSIIGLQTNASTQYGISFSNSGTVTDIYVDMISKNDTSGAVNNNSANVLFNGRSATAGAPGWTAANGSLWQDIGTNIYKRTGGSWATI